MQLVHVPTWKHTGTSSVALITLASKYGTYGTILIVISAPNVHRESLTVDALIRILLILNI